MFANYYYELNISPNASELEIDTAINEAHFLPKSFLDEISMVLHNKSLKSRYDAELRLYDLVESKESYEISDPILERELIKIRLYIAKANEEYRQKREKENRKKEKKNYWEWVLITLVIVCLGKCGSSYEKGRQLEEHRQEFLRGDYDDDVKRHFILDND